MRNGFITYLIAYRIYLLLAKKSKMEIEISKFLEGETVCSKKRQARKFLISGSGWGGKGAVFLRGREFDINVDT